jgi:Ca2+-binding RTX toxin-like protein
MEGTRVVSRLIGIGLGAGACLVGTALPTAAVASAPTGIVSFSAGSPDVINFVAAPGATNALVVDYHQPLTFTDSEATLTAGDGCLSLGPSSADCSSALLGDPAAAINVDLGSGDDTAHVVTYWVSTIWGGSGNDTIFADNLGTEGPTFVYGGPGNDDVTAGGDGSGGQIADGGPGNDIVHAGGFAGAASGFGGPGDDTIYYQTQTLTPPYPATLDGGDGNDTIIATDNLATDNTVSGGNGNDVITIVPLSKPVPGAFNISGGNGDDVITGGPGNDTVDGGNGNDFIDVRGGGADTVTCGAGRDTVLYDASDTVSGDCEVATLS